MATNPNGGQVSKALTDYAFQILPDYAAIMADAKFIAPRVVTGAASGNFAKFDDKAAFMAYDAGRAIGGSRTRIKFAGENATYTCLAKALEVGLDEQEIFLANNDRALIERAKVQTLVATFAQSAFKRVYDVAVKSGNFTATTVTNAGVWSAPADPLAKIDAEINAFYVRTGMLPNRFGMDFASWLKLRNHPEVIKRQPGSANIGVTLGQLSQMLAAPVECRLFTAAVEASFGANTASKTAVAANTALLFYAQDGATVYDPSAIKVFTPLETAFDSVKQYREDQTNSDIFYIEANEAITSISALLMTKFAVT
jgi:hypothetical protein